MKVVVTGIGQRLSQGVEVAFTTPYGVGKGLWVGPTPQLMSQHDVELEVENKLSWGDNLSEAPSRDFIVGHEVDNMLLQGSVASVDADGVCALRLGDSITLVTVIGEPPSLGTFIRLTNIHISLHDTHI